MKNKRIKYLIIFIIIFMVEVFIGAYSHSGIIRNYVGDILVIPIMYFFIRIIYPKRIRKLPYILFLFAVIVEILQYMKINNILGIEGSSLLGILLGSTGDIKDILCYFIGTIIIIIIDVIENRRR
ncbi:DUF2809 domain-containing protein [Clostridium sp. MSJ-8]|uniref:ribosomal maturation YjgA family protein n=1 Tax=Clostridium sp. MSJ-8 TaxID=2841510 RepID=UPI001C0ED9CA|nr:DUF2809 domain-containing protein [Clostridium sp. MSJ-8]MBU5488076.1 DUF2809 domain-containing protein [Clostridium sp. MSJ-8]